jgi:hypothetical protein
MKAVYLATYTALEANHHAWFRRRKAKFKSMSQHYTKNELWQLRADLIAGRILTLDEQIDLVEAFFHDYTQNGIRQLWIDLIYGRTLTPDEQLELVEAFFDVREKGWQSLGGAYTYPIKRSG